MAKTSNGGVPVIGLTGGIASGKTSVSGYLAGKGAYVIDADSVGHGVIAPDGEAYGEVLAEFGRKILATDGSIDRKKLGALVFADPERRRALERISHPRMAERMAREIAEVRARPPRELPPLILLDAAILFEAGWDALCDHTWAVLAGVPVSIERLMARNQLSMQEAAARLKAQLSNEARAAKAERVIWNDGSLEELFRAVEPLWLEATGA